VPAQGFTFCPVPVKNRKAKAQYRKGGPQGVFNTSVATVPIRPQASPRKGVSACCGYPSGPDTMLSKDLRGLVLWLTDRADYA